MTVRPLLSALLLGAIVISSSAPPAHAASCGSGSFDAWLNDFKNEAAAKGISQGTITA
jgi:membrane-bound lytic murein transglycosylase B